MYYTASVPPLNFCQTVAKNVDNTALSDEEFRQFIRNSLPIVKGIDYSQKVTV